MKALEDYMFIEHDMKLTQWLHFLIDPPQQQLQQESSSSGYGINKLVVLPMEEHFNQLIDGYILHLLQEKYGNDAGSNMQQIYFDQIAKIDTHDMNKHSTSSVHHVPPLTSYGECCIARHLEDDYQLIRTMIGEIEEEGEGGGSLPQTNIHPVIRKACTSWGTLEQQQLCLSDLSSMLQRRSMYLDRSKCACSELFGG